MTSYFIHSPLGKLKIDVAQDQLISLEILHSTCHSDTKDEIIRCAQDDISTQDDSCNNIHKQLHAYFSNPAHPFTVKVNPAGTAFQRRVWQALQSIPSGSTLTYGELARQLGSGPRAVGQACRRNPIPIIIPCHRVVASQHIGGYAGAIDGQLLSIKQWLLDHENIH